MDEGELDMVSILRAGGVTPAIVHCGDPLQMHHASKMDEFDPLRKFRTKFCIPSVGGNASEEVVYLAGHSLGLQPKTVPERLITHCDKWASMGVDGHFSGQEPWVSIEDNAAKLSLDLVGATDEVDVVYMNSLSVNLHLLMTAFYRPEKGGRYKILVEDKAFSSDEHIAQSQVKLHGLDPQETIIHIFPPDGEMCLKPDAIINAITENSNSLALILLPGVQYFTGQVLPMQRICEAAQRFGIPVGLDLAHAVGNVPLKLDSWGVDFACWCTYKYLNSGPGALAGAYLHSRHRGNTGLLRLAGWWGHDRATRFKMGPNFHPQPGIRGFQLSNPSVFGITPIAASLEIFHDAGMKRIGKKSTLLNLYFLYLMKQLIGERVQLLTPQGPDERGCQVSMRFENEDVSKVRVELLESGIICDTREPDVMRVTFAPLYNTFEDVWYFVTSLDASLKRLAFGIAVPHPGVVSGPTHRKRSRPST